MSFAATIDQNLSRLSSFPASTSAWRGCTPDPSPECATFQYWTAVANGYKIIWMSTGTFHRIWWKFIVYYILWGTALYLNAHSRNRAVQLTCDQLLSLQICTLQDNRWALVQWFVVGSLDGKKTACATSSLHFLMSAKQMRACSESM